MQFDIRRLKERCLAPVAAFYNEGQTIHTGAGPFVWVDRQAPVLAVAHLDTVFPAHEDTFGVVRGSRRLGVVCPHLDDRLGVHIILDILPALGIAVDVLLTDGEEHGRSTAAYFAPPREYNWIVEFDRAGSDVVLYQYDDRPTRKLLKPHFPRVGHGSFSDISSLEHLGVKALNVGCGYEGAHTSWCHADLHTTAKQLRRFAQFYAKHAGTRLPHTKRPARRGQWELDFGLSDLARRRRDEWDWLERDGEVTYQDMLDAGLITHEDDRRFADLIEMREDTQ